MRRVQFTVAIWDEPYIQTFLRLALPSFLAPGNVPTCASLADVGFMIVTRPEDVPFFAEHPALILARSMAAVEVVPVLTPDCFDGNRYSTMALAHRHVIARCLRSGSILSILSPDCIVADGGLSFGLRKILEGDLAVLVAGPRAVLEDMGSTLGQPPFMDGSGTNLNVPPRELVSLLVAHPHAMSRILFWSAEPFSAFPSAVYWAAGRDSLLARYFHLHPLFVDMANADPATRDSGTVDGTLMSLAGITPERTFVATRSDDICVIELSRMAHDPMGSVPRAIEDKTEFLLGWAETYTAPSHVAQFQQFAFLFQGVGAVDWQVVQAAADDEIAGVMDGLDALARKRDAAKADARRAAECTQPLEAKARAASAPGNLSRIAARAIRLPKRLARAVLKGMG